MAELPSSFNLRTEKTDKGTVNVVGKDDAGRDYTVRRCDNAYLTDTDVSEIAAADRELYRDTKHAATTTCNSLIASADAKKRAEETQFENELVEAAGPVVHAGLEKAGLTVGLNFKGRAAQNFDNWIKSLGGDN